MYQPQEEQRSTFRLDVPLHQLLTTPVSERIDFQPIGVPQRFPGPIFPQHPELLGGVEEDADWSPPEKRHWTAGQIYRTMQGWLFPYIRSRVTSGDFHPLIAYLFTEFKCNLDCHYCWAFDNKVKGMTEDTAKRSVDWLHGAGCRVLAFMGGEPLLRPDLIHRTTHYVAKKDFWIYLPTNARLLRADVIDKLADAGMSTFNIAVDAVDVKEGLPKALAPIRNQFDYLIRKQYRYGYSVFLNINICRNNLEDVRQLTEIAHDNGIATDWHIMDASPAWMRPYLEKHKKIEGIGCTLGKIAHNIYGKEYVGALRACRDSIDSIEVDRLRVKPVIKITGEFWAQTTEGDGNFNMFAFLEKEGAQVLVEPIATWIDYMMYVAKEGARARAQAQARYRDPKWYELKKRAVNGFSLFKKTAGMSVGSTMWTYFYHRTIRHMGDIGHHLIPQSELAHLAHPFYHQLARGGEGHMEVGKNIFYTVNHLCHMVLALKPFGCMPSTQSDGVQSRVVSKFKDMIFLPIETSGEGEVNAHSRVQMALAEAKAKAGAEFDGVLRKTGKSIDDLREYVAEHPQLRRGLYKVPHREGLAGTAAQFAWHVNDLMNRDRAHRRRVAIASTQVA